MTTIWELPALSSSRPDDPSISVEPGRVLSFVISLEDEEGAQSRWRARFHGVLAYEARFQDAIDWEQRLRSYDKLIQVDCEPWVATVADAAQRNDQSRLHGFEITVDDGPSLRVVAVSVEVQQII